MDNTSLVQWGNQTLILNVKQHYPKQYQDSEDNAIKVLVKFYGATTPKQYPELAIA